MLVLVINPGSTSTRLALFNDTQKVADDYVECSENELSSCKTILDQVPMREKHVEDFLAKNQRKLSDCKAIAARGAPLRPMVGGVYRINQAMLDDVKSDHFVDHVSKVAAIIAYDLGQKANLPAFTVDHISTDEYDPISRISGLPDVPRKSLTHALNMKAVARIFAEQNKKSYEQLNLITAHIGGGMSVAVHKGGRMIDSVDANGEASFSPERSGGLRSDDFAKWVLSEGKPFSEIRKILTRKAGLFAHLGTTNGREIEARINNGDTKAEEVFSAMAYNIAKNIAALSVAVDGKIDGIILTGGLANSKMFTEMISRRVSFIAKVSVIAGEKEMEALNAGVMRVLSGKEQPRIYPNGEFEA